jgi:hypothetical protein
MNLSHGKRGVVGKTVVIEPLYWIDMAIKHIGLSILLAASLGGALRADNNEINWLGDYKEGLRTARETGKPLLVEFRCEA